MTNNDILRRLRYTFNFNDKKMVLLFQSAGLEVTTPMVVSWLKKEDDPDFVECTDAQIACFLNGLIIDRRGADDKRQQPAEKRLNNNIILVKLKIALSLRSDDIVELMQDTHLKISKSELGAFLRKPDHKHFKKCHDQFLRNFLLGIDNKFNVKRPAKYVVDKEAAAVNSGIYQKSAGKFSKAKPASTERPTDRPTHRPAARPSAQSQKPKAESSAKPSEKANPRAKSEFKSNVKAKAKPVKSGPKTVYVNPQANAHVKPAVKKDGKRTLSRKPGKSE